MKIYIVAKTDVESYIILKIFKNKASAEKYILKARDELMGEYRSMIQFCKDKRGNDGAEMYQNMIDKFKDDDWTKWDNYPHENLIIEEQEIYE